MSPFLYRNYYLRKIYFQRSELERVLILSSLFSISLAFARVVYTGQLMFLSLIWNLFLGLLKQTMQGDLLIRNKKRLKGPTSVHIACT